MAGWMERDAVKWEEGENGARKVEVSMFYEKNNNNKKITIYVSQYSTRQMYKIILC